MAIWLGGCIRQADTLDTRDFSEPCTLSCEHSFECNPESASEAYENVDDCIEQCNDNTLKQWSEACAELTTLAWECNASLSCEQAAAASDDPESSPCHTENEAFAQCTFSGAE